MNLAFNRCGDKRNGVAAYIVSLIALLMAADRGFAGSATWNASPNSNDWNTPTNWTPATVPNGVADVATFGNSNTTSVAISNNTGVGSILFDITASPFTITANPTSNPFANLATLTLSGSGIVNQSGSIQNFVIAGIVLILVRNRLSTLLIILRRVAGRFLRLTADSEAGNFISTTTRLRVMAFLLSMLRLSLMGGLAS